MPTTTRAGLRYPTTSVPPNVPQDLQLLAEDVDAQLYRAYPCDAATVPTGVPNGFLIDRTDLGELRVLRAGSWVTIASTVGGGGGDGSTAGYVAGQWSEDTPQSIPFNTNTAVRFSDTDLASAVVTRSPEGAGHKFTVSEAGLYAVSTTVRFAAGGAGGNRYLELRNAAGTVRYAAIGADGGPGASTLHLAEPALPLAAGDTLLVIAAQSQTGSAALSTQPVAGSAPTRGWQQIRITKVA